MGSVVGALAAPLVTVRIAQITDIHWQTTPSAGELLGKRLLGSANLFVRGRAAEFDRKVQQALVDRVVALAPDAVVVSGDLTAQALDAEFALARQVLDPLLTRFPTLVMNGNHDVYTAGAMATGGVAPVFGAWMGLGRCGPVARLDIGDVTVFGLDPNRFHATASGWVPEEQLSALESALGGDDIAGRSIVLAIHYPVVGPSGRPYTSWGHGLRNAPALIDVLARAKHAPLAVVHGHKHHAYGATIAAGDRRIASFDPGAGGLTHGAAIGVYTVGDGKIGAERLVWNGTAFVRGDWPTEAAP